MSEETPYIAQVFYYTTTLISQTRSVCVRGNTLHSSGILIHFNFDQSNKVSQFVSEETPYIALVFYYTTTLISQTRSVCVRGNTQHSSGILLHYNFDQSNKVSLCQRKHPT